MPSYGSWPGSQQPHLLALKLLQHHVHAALGIHQQVAHSAISLSFLFTSTFLLLLTVCILQPLPALRLSSQTVKLGMHISGIVSMFKGHVAHLVRHPCGAAIIDDVYHVASAQQRTAMVAELYGREFVLFSGEAKSITDFINELPLPKQKAVIRNMSQHAIPIMEKALVDSPLVHR